jgi:hypothetical protein
MCRADWRGEPNLIVLSLSEKARRGLALTRLSLTPTLSQRERELQGTLSLWERAG